MQKQPIAPSLTIYNPLSTLVGLHIHKQTIRGNQQILDNMDDDDLKTECPEYHQVEDEKEDHKGRYIFAC